MNEFDSVASRIGRVLLPEFTGKRIMMMPFLIEDLTTLSLSQVGGWRDTVQEILKGSTVRGIGYLTVDETIVEKETTHRRPGLHVDGYKLSSYGGSVSYGGGSNPYVSPYAAPAPYAAPSQYVPAPYGAVSAYAGSLPNSGMYLVASNNGTRAFIQNFKGSPGHEGDCEHLRKQCKTPTVFADHEAWWCSGLLVHEGVPATASGPRQFLRISMPSDAPYHWPYTENVTGIKPITSLGPDRKAFMAYKES